MRGDIIKSFKLLSSLPELQAEGALPWALVQGSMQASRPEPPAVDQTGEPFGGSDAERARGRVGGLGNGETNSIFCSAVEGGLLWPTGSRSEAISDRAECLVFPGAEAAKPRKPSLSLPLISCLGKCSVRRQRK